jgi:hypothetical protein
MEVLTGSVAASPVADGAPRLQLYLSEGRGILYEIMGETNFVDFLMICREIFPFFQDPMFGVFVANPFPIMKISTSDPDRLKDPT